MYLLSTGDSPITVAEIKLELGLTTDAVDAVIQGGLALACSLKDARPSVWLIEIDEGFDARVDRTGKVKKMGPERLYNNRPYREVHFLPKPESIRAAKAWTVRWAMQQTDILDAIEAERRDETAFLVAAE